MTNEDLKQQAITEITDIILNRIEVIHPPFITGVPTRKARALAEDIEEYFNLKTNKQ